MPFHQPLNAASGDFDVLFFQLAPDLSATVDTKTLSVDPFNFQYQTRIIDRPFGPIISAFQMPIVRGRGDLQYLANRLDPIGFAMSVDKHHRFLDGRCREAGLPATKCPWGA